MDVQKWCQHHGWYGGNYIKCPTCPKCAKEPSKRSKKYGGVTIDIPPNMRSK